MTRSVEIPEAVDRPTMLDRLTVVAGNLHELAAADASQDLITELGELDRIVLDMATETRPAPAGHEDTRTDEERGFVEIALAAADSGSAGHWPTVAGYLADEVRRLRAAAAVPQPVDRPTREQIAEALHDNDHAHSWRDERYCPNYACLYVYLPMADVILPLLASEQEQVESQQ